MDNKNPDISVIMPVYNGLEWLNDSISSILNQTYCNFEFIIVNDESTDDSYSLLQKYAKQDKRIRLFNNQNRGPGESLNFGIQQAKGEYLCFIDQDDMYVSEYLEKMLNAIHKYGADFVMCYGHFFNQKKNVNYPLGYPYFDTGMIDLSNLNNKKEFVNCFTPQWTKMLKREFVVSNDIRFGGKQIKAHDLPFHLKVLHFAQNVYILHDDLYCHRIHENQITESIKKDFYVEFFATIKDIENFAKKNKIHDKNLFELCFELFAYVPMDKKYKKQFNRFNWKYHPLQCLKRIFYCVKQTSKKRKIRILFLHFSKKIKVVKGNNFLEVPKINILNVGKHSYCANQPCIANPIETVIGNFVSIGKNCQIGCGNHPLNYLSTSPYFYFDELGFKNKEMIAHPEFWNYEGVKIGHDVWIGDNVSIMNGINVGNGAVIGMGAVVTRDVPPYAIVAGVPAKIIRYRFEPEMIKKLLVSEWWYLSDNIIRKIPYDDINQTIKFLEEIK